MSPTNNRRSDPGGLSSEAVMVWVVVIAVVTIVAGLWVSMHLGHRLAGTGAVVPMNPFEVAFGLLGGSLAWPGTAGWVVLIGLAVVVVLLAIIVGMAVSRRRRRRTRVDSAAAYMGRGRDVEGIGQKHAQKMAKRLGVRHPADEGDAQSRDLAGNRGSRKAPSWATGVPIGKTVADGASLFGSWEDTHVDIWGPRTGKTTSRAIPAILEAPGAVLVTSNKRDVVDATRDPRSKAGDVWVFDPQGLTGEEPTWWWNPLSFVTDEVRATELMELFVTFSRDEDAKTDAYFDGDARDLLTGFILAAALDDRPLSDVYRWVTRPTEEEPADILDAHGYDLIGDQVRGVIEAPDKQRGGVYGSARQMVAVLRYRKFASWVMPQGPNDRRPQFSPEEFVRTRGTLYSLSKEGPGTAGAFVTALTVAVLTAAEQLAIASKSGRLVTPLVCVLDEAANVCRWRQLPNLYSHYGSRGIIPMTILQSWSQGIDVWGQSGMKKLWSAANIKVYGGGVAEDDFLESLSKMIGDYDRMATSTSYSRGQRTVSQQLHRERILDVEALGALPKGRAVVLSSGSRATLVATQPWMTGPHSKAVQASILAHDPEGEETIAEAHTELAKVQSTLETQEGAA